MVSTSLDFFRVIDRILTFFISLNVSCPPLKNGSKFLHRNRFVLNPSQNHVVKSLFVYYLQITLFLLCVLIQIVSPGWSLRTFLLVIDTFDHVKCLAYRPGGPTEPNCYNNKGLLACLDGSRRIDTVLPSYLGTAKQSDAQENRGSIGSDRSKEENNRGFWSSSYS